MAEYTMTSTEGRESAKSRIRYKIEEYQRKAEDLQALLDMLEVLDVDHPTFTDANHPVFTDLYSDKADRILYEMVCKLK